jgi:two-component system alkaline phosphatase synthesis response regulator PhoP
MFADRAYENSRPHGIAAFETRRTAFHRKTDTGLSMPLRCASPMSNTADRSAPREERRKQKVLVVDDERHIVRLVQVTLEREGYEVVSAFDGKDALKKVASEKPDLIVLDVMMPRMDGFEVLKHLRADPARYTPVIMLTAKAQDVDVFNGWRAGVDCYLTKPFNPQELLTFARRILSGVDEYSEGSKSYDL